MKQAATMLLFLLVAMIGVSQQVVKPAPDSTNSTKKLAADSNFYNGITFLNAFNFDFSNKFSTSYLGEFNIFAPHAFAGNSKVHNQNNKARFGLNAGFEKVNYTTGDINGNDSSQSLYFHQKVLINPLDLYKATNSINDTIKSGAWYWRQLNKYTFTASNVVFSSYFEFLWNSNLLSDDSDKNVGLYLNFHTEFLVNSFTKTANIQNIAQDSVQVKNNQTHQGAGFLYYQTNQILSNYNFVSPFFGLGFTGYIKPFKKKKNIHIFGEVIWGIAKNTPNFKDLLGDSIPPALNGTYSGLTAYNSEWNAFYLVKVEFIDKITKNSDLIIGYNQRGIFNQITYPQWAAYIGLNLGLDPILNAIIGDGKANSE